VSDEPAAAPIASSLVDPANEPTYQPIVLAAPDPAWPAVYAAEADRLRSLLGEEIVLLEHIGSTSVPGLPAKPRIDMLLVVRDPADEDSWLRSLLAVGYTLRIREPDWYQHRVVRGPDAEINLHVVADGCPEINRWLDFRDWLRSHPEDRDAYAATKRALAQRSWKYVNDYADAKSEIIESIIAKAQSRN
jgi:GrpB-like predicted nucleotidyltransferase (UPF0157 family)